MPHTDCDHDCDTTSASSSTPSQQKLCFTCMHPLDNSSVVFLPTDLLNLCSTCRDSRLLPRDSIPTRDLDAPCRVLRRSTSFSTTSGSPIQIDPPQPLQDLADVATGSQSKEHANAFLCDTSTPVSRSSSLPITIPTVLLPLATESESSPTSSSSPDPSSPCSFRPNHDHPHFYSQSPPFDSRPSLLEQNNPQSLSPSVDVLRNHDYPDPLADITRLRVRSNGFKCLYPGATFTGIQKSGRNAYDVTVTLVDVDFASSFLCGYLRIHNLTDDWPELTTYFDAQIIGTRYGFDTQQQWGATRQEDLMHWARFPRFRALQSELKEPNLYLPANREKGCVFMRWKERFLVPDHRVEDICGASFAGFYYVCIDFEPQQQQSPPLAVPQPLVRSAEESSAARAEPRPTRRRRENMPWSHGNDYVSSELGFEQKQPKPELEREKQRQVPLREPPPTATMCGFYYHQNSEPYQQLTLKHVPNAFRSSFEFR